MDFGRTMCAGDLGVPMIDLETLPADKQDLVKIQPEFPKRYIGAETGRKGHDLFFGRRALVGDVRFWLWGFIDDGETCYVDVSAGKGTTHGQWGGLDA